MNVIPGHDIKNIVALILNKDPVEAIFFASCLKSLNYRKTVCVIFPSLDDTPPTLMGGIIDVALLKGGMENEDGAVTTLLESWARVVLVIRENGEKTMLNHAQNDRLFYLRKDELRHGTLDGIIWSALETPRWQGARRKPKYSEVAHD